MKRENPPDRLDDKQKSKYHKSNKDLIELEVCKYDQSDKKSCNNLLIESHHRHNKNVLSPKDIKNRQRSLPKIVYFETTVFMR